MLFMIIKNIDKKIMGLIFIIYALNFYIKSRMNDYAMFMVLGTSRKKMILFLVVEYTVIFIASTVTSLRRKSIGDRNA